MKFDFVTIFPQFFEPLKLSLIGKAQDKSLIEIGVHDLRDHATNVHRQVDDTPYGGGAGMVMMPEVWEIWLQLHETELPSQLTSPREDVEDWKHLITPDCLQMKSHPRHRS